MNKIVLFYYFFYHLFSCQKKIMLITIIYGGTIYTVDSINSVVEAVAIKDDLIYKIGDYQK